jgi:hypothetical protein
MARQQLVKRTHILAYNPRNCRIRNPMNESRSRSSSLLYAMLIHTCSHMMHDGNSGVIMVTDSQASRPPIRRSSAFMNLST